MRTHLLLASALLFYGSCAQEPSGEASARPQPDNGKPDVLTTFYPLTYFATRVAGDLVNVRCPLPADADPIHWKPSADDVAEYQAADLVIANGARLEKWIRQVSLPTSRLVKTAERFRETWGRVVETTHSHGPEGEHSHYGVDGHTWLDPRLAVQQSRALTDALVRLLPDSAAELERGFASLEEDLKTLHQSLEALGSLPDGQRLYASHPAYNYLARRHGWRIENLDLSPDAVPGAETLALVRERLSKKPGRYLLWEDAPNPAVAAAFEKIGLQSLVFRPCEQAPKTGEADYLDSMRANIQRLARAFQ